MLQTSRPVTSQESRARAISSRRSQKKLTTNLTVSISTTP